MMNIVKYAALAATIASAAAAAQDVTLDTPAKGFSYSLGIQTGANIVKQLPQAVDDIDLQAMMMGIRDQLQGRENRMDVAELTFWSGKFLQMLEEREKARKGDNLTAGEQFRAAYAARDGVTTTSSGVLYRVLSSGDGRQPGVGQQVTMHYRGSLIDGSEFDNSRTQGEPHTVKVRELRAGLQEAITLMQAGSVWEIVVPPELAYGEAGVGRVGPNETLVYEVELLEIK